MMFKETLNGDFFGGYVKHILAPTLKPSNIIIMDNCSVHTACDVLEPIYEKGASVLFLPEYSPDLLS
jgi:transposase